MGLGAWIGLAALLAATSSPQGPSAPNSLLSPSDSEVGQPQVGAPLGADAPLEVRTTHGPVRGYYNGSARAFLGIPYAAPPVGALRFRKPQPPATWSAVKPATRWPSACIGETSPSAHSHISTMDEDCLYLNVFTPRTMAADEKLPVLFWIHVSPTSLE